MLAPWTLLSGLRRRTLLITASQIIQIASSKSCEILFAYKSFLRDSIVLKFCTEHGSDTAMLCAKFQNNWTIQVDVMDELHLTGFEFKMSFGHVTWGLRC